MSAARAVVSRLARRPLLVAALVYAAASLAMVGPGLVPGRTLSSADYLYFAAPWKAARPDGLRPPGGSNAELADSVSAFGPFTRYTRAGLPGLSLWNPAVGAGRPLLADMQSAQLSPFSVPSYVLPFWWSLGIVAALKLFIASLGMFVLARALRIGLGGSLVSGLAFGLSLWMVTWVAWPLASVWALLPWLLAAVDRVVRRPDATGVAVLGVASGLSILAGHPESTLHTVVAAGLFAVLRLSRTDHRVRRAAFTVLGLGAGAGLAAIVIVPFLELVGHSNDIANRAGANVHLPTKDVLGLVFPEYWGRPTQFETQPFINARAFYAGALPLLLALVAVLRPTRERVAIAATTVLTLLVVLGVWPFYAIATALPGLGQTYLTRLGVFVCLGIALLAGWGLDDVLHARRRPVRDRRDRLLVPLLAAAVALPVAFVVVHGRAQLAVFGRGVELALGIRDDLGVANIGALLPTASSIAWLLFAGLGVALIILTVRGRVRPPVAAALAVGLVLVDLLRFGVGENPAIPTSHARQPATAAVSLLQARTPARFVGVTPRSAGDIVPLPADAAIDYGLQDARSYDYPVVARYDRLWRNAIAPTDSPFIEPTVRASTTPLALRMLGLLGVRSVLQQPSDPPLRQAGLRLIYDRPDARIYDNTRALPRAWIVDRQTVVPGGDAAQLQAIESPTFKPAATVLVGDRLDGVASGAAPESARARPAEIVHYGGQHVTLRARTPRRSVVVLSDVSYPGWHATVDGHAAPIHRVDYLLRGVTIGRGEHTIEFTYRPASFRIGWIITLLSAVALSGAVVYSRRRARRTAT